MKISAGRADFFVRSPDPSVHAALVYGPDQGLVQERAKALIKSVLEDPDDPFRLVSMPATVLKSDPQRLGDEAGAMSMTGGRRVVHVHGATNDSGRLFAGFLEDPAGDALIVVEAGDLSPGSLRTAFEKADNAAAIPCYRDDDAALATLVQQTIAQSGKTCDRNVVRELVNSLGTDRLVTRSELQKLMLYVGDRPTITLDDVTACVGDSALLGLNRLTAAAGSGDHNGAARALHRLKLEGTNAVAWLRALLRHLQRLHRVVGLVESGVRRDQAIRQLRPPVHFKAIDSFRDQSALWTVSDLSTALALTQKAEADCKTTGMPADLIAGLAIMRVTEAARRKRHRR